MGSWLFFFLEKLNEWKYKSFSFDVCQIELNLKPVCGDFNARRMFVEQLSPQRQEKKSSSLFVSLFWRFFFYLLVAQSTWKHVRKLEQIQKIKILFHKHCKIQEHLFQIFNVNIAEGNINFRLYG